MKFLEVRILVTILTQCFYISGDIIHTIHPNIESISGQIHTYDKTYEMSIDGLNFDIQIYTNASEIGLK